MISKMEVLHFFEVLEIGDYVSFCLSFNSILGKVKVKVAQPCRTLYYSMDCSSWNSPGQNTGMGSLSLFQGTFPQQGELRSPALQVDSLPAEPQGKSKNTGVGSLSLLQQIFPGIKLGSPALQEDSLPTELSGKPYNTE